MSPQTLPPATLPPVQVSRQDLERMDALLDSGLQDPVIGLLQGELERARVLDDAELPADVVRLNGWVTYRQDDGPPRRVSIVLPQDSDISEGRVSLLTPIGSGLIGLSAGQSIDWPDRSGTLRRLAVLKVEPPTA